MKIEWTGNLSVPFEIAPTSVYICSCPSQGPSFYFFCLCNSLNSIHNAEWTCFPKLDLGESFTTLSSTPSQSAPHISNQKLQKFWLHSEPTPSTSWNFSQLWIGRWICGDDIIWESIDWKHFIMDPSLSAVVVQWLKQKESSYFSHLRDVSLTFSCSKPSKRELYWSESHKFFQ